MNTRLLLVIFLMTSLMPAYAYNYNATPTGTVNPPETMSQDPNIPTTPMVYGPAKPLSKVPPPGTVAMPGATNNNNTNYTPVYNNTSQ